MANKIHIRSRDPKIYELAPNDLGNNIKEGRLFYRSRDVLYLIEACPSESVGSGCGCPMTASSLLVCGDISASGLSLTEGSVDPNGNVIDDEIDLTGNVVIGTNCDNTLTVNASTTFNCPVTASIISSSTFTGSFVGDGSGLTNVPGGTSLSVSDTSNQTGINLTLSSDTLSAVASGLTTTSNVQFNNLQVDGDVDLNGNIVGDNSSNISGINDLTVLGNTTLGNACSDTLTVTALTTFNCPITASIMQVTSLDVIHLTSSFITASTVQTSGSTIFGDASNDTHTFIGSITASGNISGSGLNNIIGENVTLGDTCGNQIVLNGQVTASCNISASGNIIASDITASGDISASGNITASNFVGSTFVTLVGGTLDPTISQEDSDSECFITFVGSNPDGSQQSLLGDNDLKFDSANNALIVSTIKTTEIEFTDGDLAITVNDGGTTTFAQNATFNNNLQVNGNTTLGNACSDTLDVTAQTTFNCPVTASIISSSTFTGSFVGDGSNLTGIVVNPTINQEDSDSECFITFVGSNPDGSSQQMLGDNDLKFDSANNILTVTNIHTDRISHIGDTDTFIQFDDDVISMSLGDKPFMKLDENDSQDFIVLGGDRINVGIDYEPSAGADKLFTVNGDSQFIGDISGSNTQLIVGTATAGFVAEISNHIDVINNGDVLKLKVDVDSPDTSGFGLLESDLVAIAQAAGTKFIEFYDVDESVGSITLGTDGGIAIDQTSDERKKENIINTNFKLEDLLKIKIKDFYYKNRKANKKSTGVIAQELKEIMPDLVGMDSKEEFYTVDYTKFIPLLIKSVQDQQKIISSLEERIKKLEDKK